ncbi:MarR family winged helix-turn-helix transcriptional regulator [Imhoffiella purpurea]|uniref:Transcriptional regulator, MarR family n=1 Tax=Imhoffiella purpurea TaxID=1249627 RepID=W9V3G1_9GAMM|nr:MarR family transcriptional regulator [Imhoffiella purpurea]EXJ14053.1 transcriptional regulator, MarR family [Imhoffiella purpurea]
MNEYLQPKINRHKQHRCDEVLIALRRVIRAVDLHSRRLVRSHGLTAPQALILKELVASGPVSVGHIAQRINLSQATVTDILTRLESRGLVVRERSPIDRRRVLVTPTEEASLTIERGPPLLQEDFSRRFAELEDWEQTLLVASLQRIASLMDADRIDAAPVLAAGEVTAPGDAAQTLDEETPVAPGQRKEADGQ